jgi:SpoVK/Ycf46/Vps4 family AAA+-type ATPase
MTLTICWSLPFVITPLFGLRFYKVVDQKLTKFLKKINPVSSINFEDQPEGWIIGKYYIGYLIKTLANYGEEKKELLIFCSRKYFEQKMKEIDSMNDDEKQPDAPEYKIKLWDRHGSYYHLEYSKRTFDVSGFEPRKDQSEVIEEILQFYNKNKYCVVLLHGEKGSGKSMIPLLLAKKITSKDQETNFCDTFKPTDPGDQFVSLYNTIEPSKETPLIVVLEEFDIIINNIHYNKIERHKYTPSNISDKSSWNQFFDRFDRKYFPWVILVLTSNTPPEMINMLDPSYIRDGRINKTFKIELINSESN